MKTLLFLCFGLWLSHVLPAQTLDSARLIPKNTLHGELGGNNRFFGATHYTRITYHSNENRYIGYGLSAYVAPYYGTLVSIGGDQGFQLFEGIDWKRYNLSVSPYGFYLSRIRQSNTFIEVSAGYVFQYFYGNYSETIAIRTGNLPITRTHHLRTLEQYLFLGAGIRRQTRKGLFVRFYLLSYYKLYHQRLESPLNSVTNVVSFPNKQPATFGFGFGLGKSF